MVAVAYYGIIMKNCLKMMEKWMGGVMKEENSWVLSPGIIFGLIFMAFVLLYFLFVVSPV